MNIIIINHYAGSPQYGMEFRPYYLAKEWIKSGHQVLIVGSTFSHLRKIQPKRGKQNIDGIEYFWISGNKYKGNGIGRVISMISFVLKLFFNYKTLIKSNNPDVVIASSTYPLDNVAARFYAKKSGAKYIYEVHDLWPLSPIELGGMSKNHPFIQIMQWAEDFSYKNCDAVVSMLPNAQEHMFEHGLKRDKFYCVPNGIVEDDWKNPERLPAVHQELITKLNASNFTVGFAGAHGIANSLKAVIDAVASLESDQIVLVLVGTGQEKEHLMSYVCNKDIKNVYFLPSISKYQIPTFLNQMDALYIGLQKQSLFRFGISPNKIFDYMMAERPIVQAIEASNNLVEEAKCGIYVEPDNTNAIAKAILQLKSSEKYILFEYGQNGKKYVLENHTYDVLATRFLNIIQSLKATF